VQGSGFRVQGAGFRVQGSGCRVQGAGFRVQGSGYRVQGSGPRVQEGGAAMSPENDEGQQDEVSSYRTESVYTVVLQKSIPPQIRQLILYYY